jgi:HSP20 family molecular chaperone IbpA
MDINETLKQAYVAIKNRDLKTAWNLLRPHSDHPEARKRLRWIRKKTQEQKTQSQNEQSSQDDIESSSVEESPKVEVSKTEHNVHLFYSVNSAGVTPAFFDIDVEGSSIDIRLNQQHLLYDDLRKALSKPRRDNPEHLAQQLRSAQLVIDTLIKGWAMYEDEEPIGKRKQRVQNAREDWGRAVRELLQPDEDDE